jgi:hypothetical protein
VIDQAEVLIRKFGASLLVELYELVKRAGDESCALQLFFVVNSDQAVESLLALNGGKLFTVVDVPPAAVEDVERCLGATVASVYRDMEGVLGAAIQYAREDADGGTHCQQWPTDLVTYKRQFWEASYESKFGVTTAVSEDEIAAAVKGDRKHPVSFPRGS